MWEVLSIDSCRTLVLNVLPDTPELPAVTVLLATCDNPCRTPAPPSSNTVVVAGEILVSTGDATEGEVLQEIPFALLGVRGGRRRR